MSSQKKEIHHLSCELHFFLISFKLNSVNLEKRSPSIVSSTVSLYSEFFIFSDPFQHTQTIERNRAGHFSIILAIYFAYNNTF